MKHVFPVQADSPPGYRLLIQLPEAQSREEALRELWRIFRDTPRKAVEARLEPGHWHIRYAYKQRSGSRTWSPEGFRAFLPEGWR